MRRPRQHHAWVAPLVVFTLILLFATLMFMTWDIPRPRYRVERSLPPIIFEGIDMPAPELPAQN